MISGADVVEASWYGRSKLGVTQRGLLVMLSWLYALGAAVRRQLYRCGFLRQTYLPVPVIVVGNLTVGGAGKTPLTRALASQLRAAGWRPGIVSRGYGRKVAGVHAVRVGDSPDHVGDEPLLYAADGFPVFVGEKRVDAAKALLMANPFVDVLLADDGLQHYALGRDIEVVVFDSRGIGNGRLLPAGPLRESPDRLNNRRVRAQVWQGGSAPPSACLTAGAPCFAMTLVADQVYAVNDHRRRLPLSTFSGQAVRAIAGIGHPDRFFQMLRDWGILVDAMPFPDHFSFKASDIPSTSLPVLMTEKDAVKCQEFSADHDNWYVVPVSAQIEPPLPLIEWLEATSSVHGGKC